MLMNPFFILMTTVIANKYFCKDYQYLPYLLEHVISVATFALKPDFTRLKQHQEQGCVKVTYRGR